VETRAVPVPLSPHNPRFAAARDLRTARGRREEGAYAIEGPTLLAEAARSGIRPRELFGTPAALSRLDLVFYEAAMPVWQLDERAFARLSDLETPSGLLAVLPLPEITAADVLARPGVVLLLAGVADPGNAGTLVRAAEAFGAAGVLFGVGGADPYAPKVVRAAMGSLFRLPVATVAAEELPELAAAAGRTLLATELEGEDLRVVGIPAHAVVGIGNEKRGVRDWLAGWDSAIRIPHLGPAESLNAAMAGSIVLYEAARGKNSGGA